MLAPLEDRGILERADDEAGMDVRMDVRTDFDHMPRGLLVALCRERDFDWRTNMRRIAGLSEEVLRLRALCEEQRRQLAAYASGEVIVGLGRRLMALSAANDGLRDAVERERALRESLDAACAECRRLIAERDALAAARSVPSGPCVQDAREMPK